MKKLFFILLTACMLTACTQNKMARAFGGDIVINLPKGEKLIEATWKEGSNLWYLTEPMEEGYVPKSKVFREDSNYGVIEGSVTFVESR